MFEGELYMIQLRNQSALIIALIAVGALTVHADPTSTPQTYPEAAVVQIFTQEQIEQKRADELEQKRLSNKIF